VSIKKSNLLSGTRKSIYRFKQLCSVHDKIEKNLNPYKFRLSYLPEINIYNLKSKYKGKKKTEWDLKFQDNNQISLIKSI
jgi:hypothetical protein